jgi:hypothetical protein
MPIPRRLPNGLPENPYNLADNEKSLERQKVGLIIEALDDKDVKTRLRAIIAYRGILVNSATILDKAISDEAWEIRLAISKICQTKAVSVSFLQKALQDEVKDIRCLAVSACIGKKVPITLITPCLIDEDWSVRRSAFEACRDRLDIPVRYIEKGLVDSYYGVREKAIMACCKRPDCIHLVKRCLQDESWQVRCAVIRCLRTLPDPPIELIEKFLTDKNELVQYSAEEAFASLAA